MSRADADFIDPDLSPEERSDSGASSAGEADYDNLDGPVGGDPSTSARPSRPRQASSASDPKGKGKGRSDGSGNAKRLGKSSSKGKSWEATYERSWDAVREDERGSLQSAVADLLLSNGAKRVLRDTTSIQRGIIRHVYLVIDLSLAMLVREFKSSWLDFTLGYAQEFVSEFFDQNPISQMAIIGTREGTAERLSPLSGNPVDHIKALQNKKRLEARGEPSLQNVLEMARSGLSHLPPHGSREVIIIMGSLTTCDPGNIHTTIDATDKDRIRVNIIGLSAEMKICKDICTKTKGTYTVAKDDVNLKELLFEFISPPPTLVAAKLAASSTANNTPTAPTNTSDLMQMGFPTLIHSTQPGLCSCHSKLKTLGFVCPRCSSQICDVPTECRVCGLTVVSSPHLARSYRHLFPTANFDQVPFPTPASPAYQNDCESCSFPFPPLPTQTQINTASNRSTSSLAEKNAISPTGRYLCTKCRKHFCLDCDVLVHTSLGFCPGCV